MNKTTVLKRLALLLLLPASLLDFQQSIFAQSSSCLLSFPSGGGSATVDITVPWATESYPQSASSYFTDQVTVGNTEVPAGAYLGWCVDVPDSIGASQTYPTLMFSSCDPNLNAELHALGYSYPGSVYVSSQVWNEINYILNNKNGATFYDIQVAIWNLIGGPIDPTQVVSPPYPPWSQTVVNQLLAAASRNASPWQWQPQCGGVIAVVVAEITGTEPPVQLTIIEVPVPCTQTICCSVPSQNCQGGSVWCNAHLTCNPGQACTVYCQNASVTLSCKDGKSYTYPVPNCQVNFSPNCWTASCSFQGGQWCTTVPCGGDSQIFLSGCGIPWQSDFANCNSLCWTGSFSCSTPGVNCQWQCGASCYNANLCNCSTIQVKPCYQNYCGYNNSDCAGTPENYKSFCQNGNNNNGNNNNGNNNGNNNNNNNGNNNNNNNGNNNNGNNNANNYCGSWSSAGSFCGR
jgi:hypothetical protein